MSEDGGSDTMLFGIKSLIRVGVLFTIYNVSALQVWKVRN